MYALGSTLFVVQFDAAKLAVTSGPVPLIENLRSRGASGSAHIDFANNGSMVYLFGGTGGLLQGTRLVWVDRSGKEKPLALPPGVYFEPRISPDGRQIAVVNAESPGNSTSSSLWVYDVSGTSALRRLTFDNVDFPAWTRDSQRIIFRSNTAGGALFWQRADGNSPAEPLEKMKGLGTPGSASPDGKNLVFQKVDGNNSGIWVIPLSDDRNSKLLFAGTPFVGQGVFSPDGRWIVYTAAEAGGLQIYVQPFPPVGVKYQITTTGGLSPLWSPDGKQIFYVGPPTVQGGPRSITSVDVRTQPTFAFGNPTKLPVVPVLRPNGIREYDITPDGKQFLIVTFGAGSEPSEKPAQPQFRITLNWFEELKQRVH
jgi:Tol biopolymer transport system component